MKKPTPERLQSNREHHLSYWHDAYTDLIREAGADIVRMERIIERAKERKCILRNIDANRRENAIAMGVSIRESDEYHPYEDIAAKALKQIEESEKIMASFGYSYKKTIKDDASYD